MLTDSSWRGMNTGGLGCSPDMRQQSARTCGRLTIAPVLAMLVSYLLTTSMLYTMPMSAARAASSCSRHQQGFTEVI